MTTQEAIEFIRINKQYGDKKARIEFIRSKYIVVQKLFQYPLLD